MVNGKILSWFLGPKGEHGELLEQFLLIIWRDYIHWRRNYFPQDLILVDKNIQRDNEIYIDKAYQILMELLSKLRRNFPFYSPRYIAHMLSETTFPATLGYFAGMLYNPNNVTPEAAPVTVELEIEAGNQILQMLGFTPPPDPPNQFDKKTIKKYEEQLKREFGWIHITPGGTLANLEALWVSLLVKYLPLSIYDTCKKNDIDISVKHPDGTQASIRTFQEIEILQIKPNESIYLLSKFVEAVRKKYDLSVEEAKQKSDQLLQTSTYSISSGLYNAFVKYPPVFFVSRAAHYSIGKSASILGIGKNNVIKINVDSMFRMDINDLRKKILREVNNSRIPVAVIAIVGTTEEGAIDPVHRIDDLRKELEKKNISFWLHIDAAWGGFFRSFLEISEKEKTEYLIKKIFTNLGITEHYNTLEESVDFFIKLLSQKIDSLFKDEKIRSKKEKLYKYEEDLKIILSNKLYGRYVKRLCAIILEFEEVLGNNLNKSDFQLTLDDRITIAQEFIKDDILIEYEKYRKSVKINWGYEEIISALLAFNRAESVTMDPHKLGYLPYPCGIIAFRNDRVRHFILQKAPYITSADQNILIHNPPKHLNKEQRKMEIDAFGPFILEGSRPGASAVSLWYSLKTIPPNKDGYGTILKLTLLAARELYEWLSRWDKIMTNNGIDTTYQFVPMSIFPPDTNIVIFSVKQKNNNSLRAMNELTRDIYECFAIQAELGEQEYSYSQPFFLSKTEFRNEIYPIEVIDSVLEKYFDYKHQGYKRKIRKEYKKYGIVVMRATLMNPYIYLMKQRQKNLIKEFVEKLAEISKIKTK